LAKRHDPIMHRLKSTQRAYRPRSRLDKKLLTKFWRARGENARGGQATKFVIYPIARWRF